MHRERNPCLRHLPAGQAGAGPSFQDGVLQNQMMKLIRDMAILSFAGGLLYLNVLDAPFVADDHVYIVKNSMVRNGGPLTSYFDKSFCEGALQGFECPYYRPLVTLSYRLDYLIWGLNPFGFHLTNLLIHMGVIGLFYVVLRATFAEPLVAWIATALFATHPVHVESVAFVAARTDPPAAFFILLSLLCFHFCLNRQKRAGLLYFSSILFFGLAVLTKEIAVTLPILLIGYDLLWVRPWKGIRDFFNRWPTYFPFAVVGLFYLWVRDQVLGSAGGEMFGVSPLWERLAGVPVLIQEYLTLLILPYPLILLHEVPQISGLSDPVFLYSLGLLVFLTGGLFWGRKKNSGIVFGGIWFLVTLFPVLNIVPIPAPAVMERSAYLPSIGFCLSIGCFVVALIQWMKPHSPSPSPQLAGGTFGEKGQYRVRNSVMGVIGSVILVFSMMTIDRNRVWKDDVLLWEDLYSKLSPEFPVGHYDLGKAYYDRGEYERAASEFQRALKHRPASGVYHSLGLVYQKLEKEGNAIEAYWKAIEMGSKNPQVFYNLGVLLYQQGNRYDAAPLFQVAVRLNPNFVRAHLNLAKLYMDQNQTDEAISAFEEVVRIRPEDYLSHFDLGVLLDRKGAVEKASQHYSAFLQWARGAQVPKEMVAHANQRLRTIQEN